MAEKYIQSNKSGTKDLFQKRVAYDVALAGYPYKNLVDFHFGEKYLYGRVNRLFVPMVVDQNRTPIKKFNSTTAKERGLGAISFVVDAFNDLAQQFQKCAMTRKIDTTDPYLTTLKVYKAYVDPRRAYGDYKKTYWGALGAIFRKHNIKVKNFDEFEKQLLKILGATAGREPFTQPGFIKSRRAPVTCSGLVIEIADLDASNDQEKIDQFVNSNNWNFYLNACASYGFMVDRHVPWRLVADIGLYPRKSPMLDYAGAYGLDSTNKIINIYYKSAYLDYFENFKTGLLDLYNKVKLRNFLITEECNGRTISKRVTPVTYSRSAFFEKFSEEDFLKIYFKIRFLEEESQFPENEQNSMIDDCIELYLGRGLDTALNSFERILNKTFDYSGSLSYIVEHLKALKDAEFAESEGTTGASSGY
jgi:hypothetical protein